MEELLREQTSLQSLSVVNAGVCSVLDHTPHLSPHQPPLLHFLRHALCRPYSRRAKFGQQLGLIGVEEDVGALRTSTRAAGAELANELDEAAAGEPPGN